MASKDVKFVATFNGARRVGTSRNGNPTWELSTSAGNYRTEVDGSIGYAMGNYTGGPDSLIGREVEFTATKAGRVWDMRPVD